MNLIVDKNSFIKQHLQSGDIFYATMFGVQYLYRFQISLSSSNIPAYSLVQSQYLKLAINNNEKQTN